MLFAPRRSGEESARSTRLANQWHPRHHRTVAWPAPETGRALLVRSTLAEGRFNSSNLSLQFVRNWLRNPQRLVRRSFLVASGLHVVRDLRFGGFCWGMNVEYWLAAISFRRLGVFRIPGSPACWQKYSSRSAKCWLSRGVEPSEGCSNANRRRFLTRLVRQHSDLVEIARRNGDFKRNYGTLIGAFLYLRSLSAARGRPITCMGLVLGLVAAALARIARLGGHELD